MSAAIRVDDGPLIAIGYCLDGSIQHRIDKLRVRARTD